jgi:hypothetical protein
VLWLCLTEKYLQSKVSCHSNFYVTFFIEWDPLTIGYFDHGDSEFLNKYKRKLKIEKKLYMCFCMYGLMFIQFHYRLIVYQRPLN